MKLLILLVLILVNIQADIKQTMFQLYQNEEYAKACTVGYDYFKKYKKDEAYVSLYAFSCLKSDYIDRLSSPTAMLKFSSEARSNSAYFSVILMQKKLLYHALIDNYDLSSFTLPTTKHILSKVFDLYSKLGTHETRAFYLFEDKNDKKLTYKLYLVQDNKLNKIVIEEFYDSTMIKRHSYW